ncbi:MAG: hypothetical protein ACEPOZ_21160 [Marinifilaceae bacterium]
MEYDLETWSSVALAMVLLFFMGWILRLKWREIKVRQRGVTNRKKGIQGEKIARKILVQNGFRLLKEQVPLEHCYWVDGKEVVVSLAADFLVEKDGLNYLVEVKTGKTVANVEYGNTRRQLMEYYHVMDADGLLLLDVESQRIQEVCFDEKAYPNGSMVNYWLIFGVVSVVFLLNIQWVNYLFIGLFFAVLIIYSRFRS